MVATKIQGGLRIRSQPNIVSHLIKRKASANRIIAAVSSYFDMLFTRASRPFQAICTPIHSSTKAITRKIP